MLGACFAFVRVTAHRLVCTPIRRTVCQHALFEKQTLMLARNITHHMLVVKVHVTNHMCAY